MTRAIHLSIIVLYTERRYDDVTTLFYKYKRGAIATNLLYEIIYVLDGNFPEVVEALKDLKAKGEQFTIIQLAKYFGEATALNIALEHARGEMVLTLSAFEQVAAEEIPRVLEGLGESDMVLAQRWPRKDALFNRVQSKILNWLLGLVSDLPMHDAGCNVRAFKRAVIDEIHIYGEQHRFLPILAHQRGFTVREVKVAQAEADRFRRIYSPGIYVRRLLDFLTIFFLARFTKKPLRFFGLLGTTVFVVGLVITLYLIVERLLGVPLTNRPALLLSSLLMILGIQILAIGLIGEMIVFTHAKELKEYTVAEIIN